MQQKIKYAFALTGALGIGSLLHDVMPDDSANAYAAVNVGEPENKDKFPPLYKGSEVQDLFHGTYKEFQTKPGLKFIVVGADWCKGCIEIAPSVKKFAKAHKNKVSVYKIGYDSLHDQLEKFDKAKIQRIQNISSDNRSKKDAELLDDYNATLAIKDIFDSLGNWPAAQFVYVYKDGEHSKFKPKYSLVNSLDDREKLLNLNDIVDRMKKSLEHYIKMDEARRTLAPQP